MDTTVGSIRPKVKTLVLPADLWARITKRNVVPLAAALLVAASIGDYATGVDTTFTLLYVFPIAIGTWFRGLRFGLVLSLSAVAFGTAATLASPEHHLSPFALAWNQGGELGLFLLIAYLLDRLRDFVEEEKRQRDVAISQLRHAERLNVIGTLAAGVAHELGTPLNVITGNAELIDADGVTRERLHRSSQTILHQAKRMTTIISHLLDFGRRGGTSREWTDVATLVGRATSLLEPIATRAGCTIVQKPRPEAVTALVNASEVEQVLANLVLNAIQATPNGGSVRVGCDIERSGGSSVVCLSVEDEGTGIPASDLPRIFDPFFTTKGVGQGTGLGLSVTYGIVEDHGGTIRVTSEVGRGSTFLVRIPVPEDTARARAEAVSP